MAYGISKERKFQIGLEGTPGTAVPATRVFRGPVGSIVDIQESILPNENVGYASVEDRAYIPATMCEYAQPETEVTYEQFPIVLSSSVANVVAGTSTGSTPDSFSYAYATPSTNAGAAIKTHTLEVGNNAQAYEMEYGFVSEWGMKGAINTALTFTANWQGRQKTSTTFTGALTAPAVEEVLFNRGKLYLDALGGTIGTTQIVGQWLGFNLKHVSGWRRVFTGDGSLFFTLPVFKGADITGDITFEDATIAATIKAAQLEGTTYLMRMNFMGSTTWTGGTFTNKTLRADLAVKWLSTPANDSQDDDDVVTFPFRVVRTASVYATYTAVNLLAEVSS